MKSKVIRVLSLLTAVIMLSGFFVSCTDKPDPQTSSNETTVSTTGAVTGEIDLYADLKEADYGTRGEDGGKYIFKVLNNISNYGLTLMDTTDLSTTIDTAVFSRNSFVSSKLNIEIQVTDMDYTPNKETMERLTAAGDYLYDICYNESWAQSILALRGCYLGVSKYENYLDFSKPWWYSSVMEDMTINNNLFYVAGDLQLMWVDSAWCLAFNADITENYGASDIYALVEEGNWTYEEMNRIIKETSSGNPDDEFYGIASHIGLSSAMLAGGGIKLLVKNKTPGLVLTDADEFLVNRYLAVLQNFFESNGKGETNYIRTSYTSESYLNGSFPSLDFQGIFINRSATFMGSTIGDMRSRLPSSGINYGIIPIPKYDTNQEQYISYIYEAGAVMGIPSTIPNETAIERTSVIIEWLSAYSYKLMKPEYYGIILQSRLANDSKSRLMLDIILGLDERGITTIELDNIFRLGTASVIQLRISDSSRGISSAIAGQESTVAAKLEGILDYYKSYK